MDVLYGTGNAGKLNNVRQMLEGMDIHLVALSDLGIQDGVEESGNTTLDNARIKAEYYFEKIKGTMAVMGQDSGLYLDGVPEEEQPGVFVRRVNGRSLDDEAFIQYYAGLAKKYGGRIRGRFINGICLIFPDGRRLERFDESLSTDEFYLVDTPSSIRVPGFPMDSIAVYPESGRYWVEGDIAKSSDGKGEGIRENFRRFFYDALKMAGGVK